MWGRDGVDGRDGEGVGTGRHKIGGSTVSPGGSAGLVHRAIPCSLGLLNLATRPVKKAVEECGRFLRGDDGLLPLRWRRLRSGGRWLEGSPGKRRLRRRRTQGKGERGGGSLHCGWRRSRVRHGWDSVLENRVSKGAGAVWGVCRVVWRSRGPVVGRGRIWTVGGRRDVGRLAEVSDGVVPGVLPVASVLHRLLLGVKLVQLRPVLSIRSRALGWVRVLAQRVVLWLGV